MTTHGRRGNSLVIFQLARSCGVMSNLVRSNLVQVAVISNECQTIANPNQPK